MTKPLKIVGETREQLDGVRGGPRNQVVLQTRSDMVAVANARRDSPSRAPQLCRPRPVQLSVWVSDLDDSRTAVRGSGSRAGPSTEMHSCCITGGWLTAGPRHCRVLFRSLTCRSTGSRHDRSLISFGRECDYMRLEHCTLGGNGLRLPHGLGTVPKACRPQITPAPHAHTQGHSAGMRKAQCKHHPIWTHRDVHATGQQ